MAKKVEEGDTIVQRGEVTRVDGEYIAVRVHGYGIPLTLRDEYVEAFERTPKPRRRRW